MINRQTSTSKSNSNLFPHFVLDLMKSFWIFLRFGVSLQFIRFVGNGKYNLAANENRTWTWIRYRNRGWLISAYIHNIRKVCVRFALRTNAKIHAFQIWNKINRVKWTWNRPNGIKIIQTLIYCSLWVVRLWCNSIILCFKFQLWSCISVAAILFADLAFISLSIITFFSICYNGIKLNRRSVKFVGWIDGVRSTLKMCPYTVCLVSANTKCHRQK